jgi:NAD+ synthase
MVVYYWEYDATMEVCMDTPLVAEKLVSWIREQVALARCKGVVLGMSGGIDSSVLAVLCQRAFPQSMVGVLMPCHSSQEDMEHARIVASMFSVPTRIVVLDAVFDTLLQVLPDELVEPQE